ncbi:3-hydroxyisobutyryl-CoA hydrolase 1-like [Impatiens glandulifera]|uniref:3-hydroxyisobutyryl-CoA hydrolase 1-like n=1 Tax=Impatiens glandulifera TaxID=253017 RepID=UPI001FB0D337|nr:3-hydroxyisobutyryl-CoA hydrolase 1-like [Impatiens glandulifera]
MKYTKELLKKFGIENWSAAATPMSYSGKLQKDDDGQSVDITAYIGIIEMVEMFESLEISGLRKFLGGPVIIHEPEVHEFFEPARIIGDRIILVLFVEHSGIRKVILNRPEKLNSLNYEMINEIFRKLKAYEDDSSVNLVILKGNGKAFSAGGDVTDMISNITAGNWSIVTKFYANQLCIDHLIATYHKPLVSIVNGLVMGGGAGLSIHACFRVVTENTVFSMPEAAIGLFPDVGASFFLSRLSDSFGEYLGLTGAKLDGAEMLACGLATHFVLSKDLASMESELDVLGSYGHTNISEVSRTINKYAHNPLLKKGSPYLRLNVIDQCFSRETVEDILSSLVSFLLHKLEKWVIDAINSINSASPTSLKLFLRLIRKGRIQNLEDCLVREYTVISHVASRSLSDDLFEGARAMLIVKDKKPEWDPSRLELVKDEFIDKYFDNMDDDDFKPLRLPPRTKPTWCTNLRSNI